MRQLTCDWTFLESHAQHAGTCQFGVAMVMSFFVFSWPTGGDAISMDSEVGTVPQVDGLRVLLGTHVHG